MKKLVIGAAIGTCVLAASVVSASADLACSGNVCWHVHERYEYPARAHIVIHPDDWRHSKRVVIREHEGRGYWRGRHWEEW
jgi:hypothetical protein